MAVLALATIVAWMLLVAVARAALHARTTSDPPVRLWDPARSPQAVARLLGTLGFVLLVAAAVADLLGLPPFPLLEAWPVRVAGLALAAIGIAGTIVAQSAIGGSWRGYVDPEARTALVTTGPFRCVRNPVLTCTQVTSAGIALMVPNVAAIAAVALVAASHQVLVRLVEEPYLRMAHGQAYASYAARTGRFVPGVGRLRSPRT